MVICLSSIGLGADGERSRLSAGGASGMIYSMRSSPWPLAVTAAPLMPPRLPFPSLPFWVIIDRCNGSLPDLTYPMAGRCRYKDEAESAGTTLGGVRYRTVFLSFLFLQILRLQQKVSFTFEGMLMVRLCGKGWGKTETRCEGP